MFSRGSSTDCFRRFVFDPERSVGLTVTVGHVVIAKESMYTSGPELLVCNVYVHVKSTARESK